MTTQENGNINGNIEEEEIEDNGNYNIKEEYDEEINQENDDGQEFTVAFDIQINNGSFILLVGKTYENKLILRLVDKEDENKPSYQNEFSLDELKEINSYFNNFNNENDAINCVIKNLNESDKEIEFIDDNNIQLSVGINDNNNNYISKADFPLFKIDYVLEGEENNININIQNQNENINMIEGEEQIEEEMANLDDVGLEEVDNENEHINYNDNYIENVEHIEETNLEYSEEFLEKSGKKDKGNGEENLNFKKAYNTDNIKNNLNLGNASPIKNIKNNQNENALQTIVEESNENIKISQNSNSPILLRTKEKEEEFLSDLNSQNEIGFQSPEKENDNSIPDAKISKVIDDLKNNLDSLGGAMKYIENEDEDDQDEITNENDIKKIKSNDFILLKNEILKSIKTISSNFNSELKKQKEQNEKKIKEIKNELIKKDNQINNMNNLLNNKISSLEKSINEDKIETNKSFDELKNIKNKKQDKYSQGKDISTYNKDIEKIKNDLNSKIKEIEQKMNDLKNNFNKNNRANDNLNVNIKTFLDKVNNIENKLKQINLSNNNNSINNTLNNFDNKIKSFENKIKNIDFSKKGDNDKKVIFDKILNLENKSKNYENKINDLEKNIKILENEKDNEIYEKLEKMEIEVKEIKDKKNKSEIILNKRIEEINSIDIMKKLDNILNLTNTYENEFKNIESEIKKSIDCYEKLKNRINILENKNTLKQSSDIKQEKNKNENIQNKNNTNEETKKKVKKNKINNNVNTIEQKENNTKNYRVIKNIEDNNINNNDQKELAQKNYRVFKKIEDNNSQSKKYKSQTYNKGSKESTNSSYSVNKNNIRSTNILEKNNKEYESFTRPRPRSKVKEQKNNKIKEIENENFSQQNSAKIKKYRDLNPPIPKEYENSISESKIVEYDDIIFIEDKIKELYPKSDIDFNLVYRATEDGDKSLDFHNKCDKIGPNITIIKTKNGSIFGGFTVKNWEHLKRDINLNKPNLGSASRDPKAFGFCVNLQKIYKNERPEEFAIWCNRNFGATFKNNFFQIFDNCFKKGGYCSVKNNSHFGGQEYDYEISGGESKFSIDEIEVYEIIFQ